MYSDNDTDTMSQQAAEYDAEMQGHVQTACHLFQSDPEALRVIIEAAAEHWTAQDLRNEHDADHATLGAILDTLNPIG